MSTTVLFSKLDEVRERFPEYIAELQVLLGEYGVPLNSPEAVSSLADAVSKDGAFRADLVSLLDVISAHESQISYLELLGLLLVAAGGPEMAVEGPEIEEPVRRTLNFLLEVRRSKRDRADVLPASAAGEAVPVQDGALPNAGGPSKAQAEPITRTRIQVRETELRAFSLESAPKVERIRVVSDGASANTGRRWAWLIAACAVAGVLLGLFYPRSSAPSRAQWVAADGSSIATPVAAEPSGPGEKRVSDALPHDGHSASGAAETDRETAVAENSAVSSAAKTSRREARSAVAGSARRNGSHAETNSATSETAGSSAPVVRPGPLARTVPGTFAIAAPKPVHLNGSAFSTAARGTHPRVVLGSSGIMAANLVSSPAPAYPAQASAAQVQGEVVIEAVVGNDGSVIETRVVSEPPLLRQAALSAVQRWRYRPYETDGQASEIATEARLDFRLTAD